METQKILSFTIETALELCTNSSAVETTTLFQSVKGAFFTVTVSMDGTQTARILDRAQAMEFMDDNPCNVIQVNYVKAFGEPEEG